MITKIKPYTQYIGYLVIALLVAGLAWFVQSDIGYEQNVAASRSYQISSASSTPLVNAYPDESKFKLAAQNERFQLWVDQQNMHFKAVEVDTGLAWRSYPDPQSWENEKSTGLWYSNLLSPIMLEYIDANNAKSQSVITNVIEEGGNIEQFQWLDNGFSVVFHFPKSQFTIPVEVTLGDDFVQTKIIDEGITEGIYHLLNVKLYSQFGAQDSSDEQGYLFIPDGSGALIKFDATRSNRKAIYSETIYGSDQAFYSEYTNRTPIIMPVYGMKWGEQSFLAVLTKGEQYAKVYAAVAPSLGNSNWITAEWQYRIKFFQNTDSEGKEGFFTYSEDRFQSDSRETRYYLLSGEQSEYDGMAVRYRAHLQEQQALEKLSDVKEYIPFYAELIGADLQEGLLWDDYLIGTSTKQAQTILAQLHEAGVKQIHTIYHGWQRWGYSSYGGLFPVDRRIGGNDGMEKLIEYAHQLDGKVWLAANYRLNSSNRDGFWNLRDGLRNLAGKQLKLSTAYGDEVPYVSPLFGNNKLADDIKEYNAIAADGVLLTGGFAAVPSSDFNSNYKASREQIIVDEQRVLHEAVDEGLELAVEEGALYGISAITHFQALPSDHSYDLFVSESVPFAGIALHGLKTYSLERSNLRHEYTTDFLKSLEYGAYPSYLLSYAPADTFKKSYSIWQYSTNADDWLALAAEEYQALNEVLHDVQNQFIVAHTTMAPGVKRTVYEQGKQIIINYNKQPYTYEGVTIDALDYLVIEGDE